MRLSFVCFASLVGMIVPMQAQAKSDCALMQQLAQQHSNDMARRDSLDHSRLLESGSQGRPRRERCERQ